MVQVIQPRDIGAEIGQAIGSGIGKVGELGAQRMMVGNALKNALESSRGKGQSPFETLISLSQAFAGIPGGMQMVGEIFPTLRQEMIRQQKSDSPQAGAPDAMEQPQKDTRSVAQRVRSRTQENIQAGMEYGPALAAAQSEIGLETSQQQQDQARQSFAREAFDRNMQDAFPKGDIDSALVPKMRAQYEEAIQRGESPDRAWIPLMQKYRAAQNEIGRLRELSGRDIFTLGFQAPVDAINQARQTIPKLIEVDPDLARAKLIEEVGFGEGEASLVVRPGSEAFQSFNKSFQKGWQPGIERMGTAEIAPLREKQVNKLRSFLEKGFDPEKDSLLGLRHAAFTGGVTDDMFLQVVNEVFPDPANNEKLSPFNRNEVARLSQSQVPGLGEIFRGLMKGVFAPAQRAAGAMRGKR